MSEIRIGSSGWRYDTGHRDFYPKGQCQVDDLPFALGATSLLAELGLDGELVTEPGVEPQEAL
ncbi:hypothetical protein [Pseudomonas sp. AA27]|uniref:hypothetical protein n=1 Tax=Pseudomonas sp. AA27 TaxID=2908652 RepID=UPI003FA3640F